MGYLTEMALGFGRALASQLQGASNAVLLSLKFLEDFDDPESGESSPAEPMYTGLGLYGRPLPPVSATAATLDSPEGECEVLAWKQEDRAYAFAYRDLRISAKANPAEGEVGIAQYQGGFISLAPNTDEDGTTITIYAPRNVSGVATAASVITLDSTDGNQQITLMHEKGQSVCLTAEDKIVLMNKTGTAYIEINNDGIFLNGNCYLNGSVVLGTNTLVGVLPLLIGAPPGAASTMVKAI
jgi:hypothetical protein